MRRATGWILGAMALAAAGCSCSETCAVADQAVIERCAERETGAWMCERDRAVSCNRCVEDHFASGGDCASLGDVCTVSCCWRGPACGFRPPLPSPRFDSGLPPDAAPLDGGLPPSTCGALGAVGGQCRAGSVCAAGVTCFEDPAYSAGLPLRTLGDLGITMGADDPSNPGEHRGLGVPSDIPLVLAPVGLCSVACDPSATDDRCGSCATCSTTLGGSPAWGDHGIDVAFADFTGTTSAARPGICRPNCEYDPTSPGLCPPLHTCDPAENVCVDFCVDDRQCNVAFGHGRAEGLVEYPLEDEPYRCSFETGRCEWSPPPEAGLNTACAIDADCPHPGGICLLGGRCATLACADATGTSPGPVPCDGACVGFGGNFASICVLPCDVPEDCAPGQACSPLSAPLPTGHEGLCFAACESDADCRATARCHAIREDDPTTVGVEALSVCDPVCDPDPTDATVVPDAVECEASERCVAAVGVDHGFCEPVDQLCFDDAGCHGTQACEVLGDDLYGRCVDGCESDSDCAAAERCRRQTDEAGVLRRYGVCRADDEPCAPSPLDRTGEPVQPLRGDRQCPADRVCGSMDPDIVGRCEDAALDGGAPSPDAGTPDGGA